MLKSGCLTGNEQVKKEETMIENKMLQFPKQTPDVQEMMLDGLGKGADAAWVRHTFAQYVEDQNALMQYVMGALA